MYAQEYLTFRLSRLKPAEEFAVNREGLLFAFLKGGKGRCEGGQSIIPFKEGDVAVMQGQPGHKVCAEKGVEIVFWSFSLRLEHLFPIFGTHEISMLQSVSNCFKPFKLYPASSLIAIECQKLIAEVPTQYNLDHRSQLLRIAAVILTEEFKTIRLDRSSSASVEQRMVEVFEKLPSDQLLSLSVGELATKFGCGRRHLNRLFHQFFGFSVATLRMEMRLLRAMSLLRDMDSKIINVAEQCGFNHLGLFNTCFKRRFGVSPGEWRKQARLQENQKPEIKSEAPLCSLEAKGLCPLAIGPKSLVPLPLKIMTPQKLWPRNLQGDAKNNPAGARITA